MEHSLASKTLSRGNWNSWKRCTCAAAAEPAGFTFSAQSTDQFSDEMATSQHVLALAACYLPSLSKMRSLLETAQSGSRPKPLASPVGRSMRNPANGRGQRLSARSRNDPCHWPAAPAAVDGELRAPTLSRSASGSTWSTRRRRIWIEASNTLTRAQRELSGAHAAKSAFAAPLLTSLLLLPPPNCCSQTDDK